MNEQLSSSLLYHLYEVDVALTETENRISDDVANDDAKRSLARAQDALASALKILEPMQEDN